MLDYDIQNLLRLTKGSSFSTFRELDIAQVRKNVKSLASLTALPRLPVERVEDYRVTTGLPGSMNLRVYWPADAPGEAPALVYFHGGGFVLYDIEDYDSFCRYLVTAAGITVVSVDYRRAPEYRFPVAHEDAEAALQWVWNNAAALHIDAHNIAVGGDSAGGNLAATLAARMSRHKIPISLQLLIYPALTFNNLFPSYEKYGKGYLLDTETMRWFFDLFSNDDRGMEDDPRLHPYRINDLSILPPAIIAIAEHDILRDEGLHYYERLMEAGNGASLLYFDNLGHNFLLMAGRIRAAKEAVAEIATALRENLPIKGTVKP